MFKNTNSIDKQASRLNDCRKAAGLPSSIAYCKVLLMADLTDKEKQVVIRTVQKF